MAPGGQKTVLVVEDENSLQYVLAQKLEKEGFAVLTAGNGTDALAVALDKHPDLILLDIMMPHDGIEMLEELRRDEPYGKQVRVIFLTNLSPDTERIIQAIERHEPVFYLIKANSTPSLVVEKIQEALAG